MQLADSLAAVRWWESRPTFPNLSTNDRLMYEERLAQVIFFRAELLSAGTP